MLCRGTITTHTLLLCLLSLLSYSVCSAETYYVTPITNRSSCPDEPCLTLSEYAVQPQDYFDSNTTMKFLQGEHVLFNNFTFRNGEEYSLVNIDPSAVVSISCLYGAKFDVLNVTKVYFSDVMLLGCSGIMIAYVHQFGLENCALQNQLKTMKEGILDASNISELTINNCSFTHNHVIEVTTPVCAVLKLNHCNMTLVESEFSTNSAMSTSESGTGSVICALNSNITVQDSSFTENRGMTGAVVYAESSKITVWGTSFTGNHATSCGGVAYISQISEMTIESCTFDENHSGMHGGVLYATLGSVVVAKQSFFAHNTALNVSSIGRGGVLHLSENSTSYFINSSFTDNRGNTSGVIFAIRYSEINLIDSVFVNNRALSPRAYLGYGAVVSTQTNCFTLMRGCVFKNNSATSGGGCANIYKRSAVTISDSNLFENNRAKDGGAFTIWDSTIEINRACPANHSSCVTEFIGNTAEHGGALNIIENSTAYIQNSYFELNSANRGGAILARTNTSVTLINTSFHGNYGIGDYANSNHSDGKGGAIFAQFAAITFAGSLIVNSNKCGSGIIYMSSCNVSMAGNATFNNNEKSFLAHNSHVVFTGAHVFNGGTSNTTEEGGAITAVRSTIDLNGNLLLENNCGVEGGAVRAIESVFIIRGKCEFYNNSAINGGAVYAYNSEFEFRGQAILRGNGALESGGGIFALGSALQYYSQYNSFIQNTARNGGALYFDQTSSLYILKEVMECPHIKRQWYCLNVPNRWLKLVFERNYALSRGGAIYVTDTDASTCASKPFEHDSTFKQCFIQTIAVYESANDWNTTGTNLANIEFSNNSASDGSVLYGGLLDRCAIAAYAEIRQIQKIVPDPFTYFSKISTSVSFAKVASDAVKICFCGNGTVDCNLSLSPVSIKRGQSFTLSLAVVDQVSKLLHGHIMAQLTSTSSRLGKDQSDQSINDTCSTLHYNVFSAGSEMLYLHPEGPCGDHGISRVEVSIHINESCPVGFALSNSSLECVCDPNIKYVTNCSIDTESIVREGNFWISSILDDNITGIILHEYCPYDYCYPATDRVEVDLNTANGSNAQCAFHRSGRLCGSCEAGYSVTLGSSKCEQCTDYWLFLILPFALAGVVLVVLMMMCNLTLALGTITGLLFYANILIANRSTFFPYQKQNFLTIFISWLGLNLGIATCFYDGMDGFGKTWMQISFEVYLIVLVFVVIALGRNTRVSAFFHQYRLNPVHTLATLIMLSYEKLSRRIFSLLAYTQLKYPNKSETVWLFDPNLDYVEGKHISLAIVAFFIIVVGIVFTFILLFSKCLIARSRSVYFNNFMEAFYAPLKPNHQYWVGLLFLARNLSYLTTEFINAGKNPTHNLHFVFTLVVGLLVIKFFYSSMSKFNPVSSSRKKSPPNDYMDFDDLSVSGSMRYQKEEKRDTTFKTSGIVYKNPFHDLLETSFLANIAVLSYFTLYVRYENGNQNALFCISASIVFVTFLGIIIYHTCVYTSVAKLFVRTKSEIPTDISADIDSFRSTRTSTTSEISVT